MLVAAIVPIGWLSLRATEGRARDEAIARARSTAVALAESPWMLEAIVSPDPTAVLSGPVERIRAGNNLSFVVIMNTDGVRWTHPDPGQVGRVYLGSTAVALAGGTVIEEYVGTLGPSVRVVVPVAGDGKVVALVAAGVLMDSVRRIAGERSLQFAGIAAGSLLVGTLGVWFITRRVHRQTRGLGPLGLGRLHSYHEALLHSVRAGLVLVGHDGTVVLGNDEASDLLSVPGVHPGSPVAGLGLEPGLAELMTSGRACSGENHVAGGRVLVATQVRAVLDGVDVGWVTTLVDRTDLVRLTGELDSLRSFSDMLRSRAHEADNQLHAVVMLVEMGRPEEAVKLATATIEQSQALVDAVTGAIHDAPLAALLLGKSAQAEERGVGLRLADGFHIPGTALASGDLLLILGNLIDNAIDAAAAAGEPRWVEVGGGVDHDTVAHVRFEVSDSGPGIPPALVSHAFERGWTTKDRTFEDWAPKDWAPKDWAPKERGDGSSGPCTKGDHSRKTGPEEPSPCLRTENRRSPDERPQGRGLGLSLVAGAVRRLAGSIDVSQNPSRFVVRLPLPATDEKEGPA